MSRYLKGIVVFLFVLGMAGNAWAIDPMDAQSLQIRKFFINQSGASLTSGTAVVTEYSDANLTTGATRNAVSNLGLHISTTTIASDRNFVGIVANDCANLTSCEVIVWGPALARVACSTSNPGGTGGATAQVGTSTVAGLLGASTRGGVVMGPAVDGQASDGCLRWVFVNPSPGS